mgnify:CR=1 FL=1
MYFSRKFFYFIFKNSVPFLVSQEKPLRTFYVKFKEIDFEKSGGIVPVIVQDAITKDILTLAYTNKESLELAKKNGNSWFWSRSRNKLWMKGEESGNTQKIKEILVDCDSDAIIYLVEPSGPACHTGEKVCFHNELK